VRQHVVRRPLRPVSWRPLSLRIVERQRHGGCVGPTSAFSRLRTSTRASLVPDASRAVSACAIGEIACITPVRFASAGRTFSLGDSPLRALSSRGDACWPCLWHPCRVSHDGHCARARMGRRQRRRGRLLRARVNDACWRNDPRCLPSIESLRPATPFRAPGSGLVPAPRCGHRDAGRRRPLARADPLGSVRARPPFTRSVASGVALLWVSASLADFCNR